MTADETPCLLIGQGMHGEDLVNQAQLLCAVQSNEREAQRSVLRKLSVRDGLREQARAPRP